VTKFVTGETFIGRYGDKKSALFGDYWRSRIKRGGHEKFDECIEDKTLSSG
jgi:hypothetical protein